MGALEKYAAFVLEGSAIPPVNKKGVVRVIFDRNCGFTPRYCWLKIMGAFCWCVGQVRSFVDPQSGAVGCGYYACLNRTEDNCASASLSQTCNKV